jgi:GNAT superfamily N-acetyltransferase
MIDPTAVDPATCSVSVTDRPEAADVAAISDGLDGFNVAETGVDDRRPLAVLVRDGQTGQVVGGLTGRTSLGLWFVDVFYLPPALRGSGVGSEILRQAEQEARRRGCRAGVLYTISFQAPGFYSRHGWRVFGEVPCDPPGTSRVFMTKDLD